MDLPELTHQEYHRLIHEGIPDGYDIDVTTYWLQAHDPDRLFDAKWNEPLGKALLVQVLDVLTPHVYRSREGRTYIILPEVDPPSYDMLDIIWPSAISPWAFTIKENLYDELDEQMIFFRFGQDSEDGKQKIAKFDLADGKTH